MTDRGNQVQENVACFPGDERFTGQATPFLCNALTERQLEELLDWADQLHPRLTQYQAATLARSWF